MNRKEQMVYEVTRELFDGCCAVCGNNEIAMHHIRYGACGRKTYLGNVIPLCPHHHNLAHTNKRAYQTLLISLIDEKLEELNGEIQE